jgi:hypothetical protein
LSEARSLGIVLENKPNNKVMIKVDGSRRATMRPMETTLRITTRPARRRPATQPTTRQVLLRRTPLSSPPVDVDNVDETHAEVREGVHDVLFEEVHDTEGVHHKVDVRQDVNAAEVCDDAQAGGHAGLEADVKKEVLVRQTHGAP